MDNYDVIVIGGGPAGYTAALYAARGGLRTMVLERLYAGGQMTETPQIDNYPGFPDGIDGVSLGLQIQQGAHKFGVETVYGEVQSAKLTPQVKEIVTSVGNFRGKSVIIATGAGHRHLGLDREEALTGKGVAYCAACDGMFYRNKTVAVVGGGNSAAADAALLAKVAKKVYLIHRRDTLRAERVYHTALSAAENVEFLWNRTVIDLLGDDRLTGITVEDVHTGDQEKLEVDGVFISIGRAPITQPFAGELTLDEQGYILAGEDTKTSIPGVFAAGDVRSKAVRQIVTATADGAVAAHHAQAHLLTAQA